MNDQPHIKLSPEAEASILDSIQRMFSAWARAAEVFADNFDFICQCLIAWLVLTGIMITVTGVCLVLITSKKPMEHNK